MRVYLRHRASHVLLWSALIVAAVSGGRGAAVEAQAPAQRWDGLIELISGKYDYPPPTVPQAPTPADGPSRMTRHAVSGDGRYIIFSAAAPNLGFSDWALYIRDRSVSETQLLLGGPAVDAVISADGRNLAFTVCDQWIRPDGLPICDVWALDRQTWMWTLMSAAPSGDHGDAHSGEPVVSGTGRFVVFRTSATNLVPGNPAGVPQLVMRDRDADGNGVFDEPGTTTIEIVSAPDGMPGTSGANGPSETAEVSDDGRYVAFRSAATDLVPGDTNGVWDVFRRDRLLQQTRRLNLRPWPEGSNESPHAIDSAAISMTPDGRYVAFTSADPLLAPAANDDTNSVADVFLFDAEGPWLQRIDIGVSPTSAGHVPGNGPTDWPTLSADGRYVSLQSSATNVERPPAPARTHSYVVDRVAGTVTRVSIKRDGTEPDGDAVKPSISADGTLVTFVSAALDFAPNVTTAFDRVYAAVHFEIGPAEQIVSGGGGSATYTVTAQQHTQWWVDWTDWQYWVSFDSPPMGVGNGTFTLRANELNPNPTRRNATIRMFDHTVLFTQLEGISVTSVTPAEGPATGGTQVSVTGTGFEPGMQVAFNGAYALSTEFVSPTTLVATTPPAGGPGVVAVVVFGAPPHNGYGWLDNAFRYTDVTPPELWHGVDGNLGNDGWYTGDVTLTWGWWDPDSEVTSTSGCDTRAIATDTAGTTFTCTATSEGGSASRSVTVKRDATPPAVTFSTPALPIHEIGAVVQPEFTCTDATSGVALCQGGPLDTSVPGFHTYSAGATDAAGNIGPAMIEYAVGFGACGSLPPDLRGWWRLDGDTQNAASNSTSNATRVGLTSDVYVDALVGRGYQFEGADGYLQTAFAFNVEADKTFTIAAWLKPSANTLGTIVRSREGHAVARLANGSIAWAFRKFGVPGLAYRDTGVKLPLGAWSHVAVVLDGTTVRTYVNGRAAHTANDIGDVYSSSNYPITLGGADDRPDYFKGILDEVQLFQHALASAEIEQLFLSGSAGLCVPKRTMFEIVEPIAASYGAATYSFDVRLVDETGAPVVGRTIHLESIVGASPLSTSSAERVTDGDGRVHWDAPLKNAPRGLYEEYTAVQFDGDSEYVRQYAEPDVLVGKGVPVISWPTPTAISYSYPVDATHLNAAANVPGTFSYSVQPGTLLPADTHTLTATFTPQDSENYDTVTAETTLIVDKAVPTMILETPTWSYSGAPRPASGYVKDRFGFVIATPELTYDGSPDAPAMPGTYTVVATFAGNDNYEPASATGTLTIAKATVAIHIFAGDRTYNGAPHAAGVLITGFEPDPLPPDSVTYNGSTDNPVNAGTYTVVATYNGSELYEPATATATFVIYKATPTVSVTGGTFTYDAAAHPASGTVTGGGGTSLGAPVITYNGSPAAPVNGGTYDVLGTYAGDANHHPASGSATITIAKAAAVLNWTSPAAIVYGMPLGASQLNATSNVAGTFSYSPAAGTVLSAGTARALTATFTPADANNYDGGSVSTAIDVLRAPLTIRANDAAKAFGAPLPVFIASAAGFMNGDTFASLSGTLAFATPATAQSPVGTYPVVPSGLASTNYDVAFLSGALTIVRGAVSVTVATSPDPSGLNQVMTFTAIVGPAAPAAGAPEGIVRFFEGDTLLGARTLAAGSASLTTAGLTAGVHAIEARYDGDASFAPGVGSSPHTVNGAAETPAIAISSNRNPANAGQSVTLTADVSMAAGSVMGTLEFYDGAALLGSSAIGAGSASFTTTALTAGSHAITVWYPGGGSAPPVRSGVFVQSIKGTGWKDRPTSLALSASPTPSAQGASVTLTADVTGSTGHMPSGRVLFTVNGEAVGGADGVSVTPLAGSTVRATVVLPELPGGAHTVTATYLGDSNYRGSTAAVTQTVN